MIRVRQGRCPQRIQVDNGSEFILKVVDQWAYDQKVVLDFSRSAKPTDNAFIESFNGSFRDECLHVHWFLSIEDAQQKIEEWRIEYKECLNKSRILIKYTIANWRQIHASATHILRS